MRKQFADFDQEIADLNDALGLAAQLSVQLARQLVQLSLACCRFHIKYLRKNAASASLSALLLSTVPIRKGMSTGAMKPKQRPRS
jgi:hypothetical protein